MVPQDSPPTPGILHQFLNQDTISSHHNQFESQHLGAFGADIRGRELPSIQSLEERMSRSIDLVHISPIPNESDIHPNRPLPNLLETSNESSNHAQRLSLSLGSWMLLPPPAQYRERSLTSNLISPNYSCNDYSVSNSSFASSSSSQYQPPYGYYGTESFSMSIGDSKYLKPAQSLLEEMVSVGEMSVQLSNEKLIRRLSPNDKTGSLGISSELRAELCNNGLSLDKQELEAKLSRLVSLLEKVCCCSIL